MNKPVISEVYLAIQEILRTRTERNFTPLKKGPLDLKNPILVERFATGLDEAKDDVCWEWCRSFATTGYGKLKIQGRMMYAHRLSYLVSRQSEIPYKMCVCHHCDNRKCVNPKHLFLGTYSENILDCVAKGRFVAKGNHTCGEQSPVAKLTTVQVREIRRLLLEGVSKSQLSRDFGVSRTNIKCIQRNQIWVGV